MTNPVTTSSRQRRRWSLSSSNALLWLSLPWIQQSQASTSRRKRSRRQDAAIQSYWGQAGANEIVNLNVEYPGRHPHSRYILLDDHHSRRNLVEEENEVSKFGLRPNDNSNNSNSNNNNQIQSAMEEDTSFTSSLRENAQNQPLPYDFDDDSFMRNPQWYDHAYYDALLDDPESDMAATNANFQPIRIHFITTPLEERRGESVFLDQQIDDLLQTALPEAARLWQSHLSVYPVAGSLEVPPDVCYGSYAHLLDQQQQQQIPNADMVILVSAYDALATPSGDSMPVCGPHSLALGAACALDQWDRPVVGFINLCLSAHKETELTELDELVSQAFQAQFAQQQHLRQQRNGTSMADHHRVPLADIMVHEVAHTLGFDSYLFKFYRNATTGSH